MGKNVLRRCCLLCESKLNLDVGIRQQKVKMVGQSRKRLLHKLSNLGVIILSHNKYTTVCRIWTLCTGVTGEIRCYFHFSHVLPIIAGTTSHTICQCNTVSAALHTTHYLSSRRNPPAYCLTSSEQTNRSARKSKEP